MGLVTIAKDLTRVTFDDGNTMSFREEAERATKVDLLIVRSAYRQPFGTFVGTLPGGLELSEGTGSWRTTAPSGKSGPGHANPATAGS